MRIWLRAVTMPMVITLSIGLTSGCKEELAQTVAVVVGNHQGGPAVVDTDGRTGGPIGQIMQELAARPGEVSVVRLDGLPALVETLSMEVNTESTQTRQDSVISNEHRLAATIADSVATTPQADPLAALALAADAVRGKPEPRVVVIDNGLSTAGGLLMQTGLITQQTDPAGVAAQLRDAGMLPDLSGIDVTWLGLCSVQAPQQACPPYAKEALQRLWSAVIGHDVTFDDTPLRSATTDRALPEVDPVPFAITSVSTPATPEPPRPPPLPPLTEDRVRFRSNSNEFVDVERARKYLRPIAALLQQGTYRSVVITGCTARDPGSSTAQMKSRGRGRAQTVKDELRRLGATVPMTISSPGWECPGYIDDVENGRQVEVKAAKNRKIIITAEAN